MKGFVNIRDKMVLPKGVTIKNGVEIGLDFDITPKKDFELGLILTNGNAMTGRVHFMRTIPRLPTFSEADWKRAQEYQDRLMVDPFAALLMATADWYTMHSTFTMITAGVGDVTADTVNFHRAPGHGENVDPTELWALEEAKKYFDFG